MEWNKTLTRQEKNLNTNSSNFGSKELGHGQGNVASLKHNWSIWEIICTVMVLYTSPHQEIQPIPIPSIYL